MMEYMRERDVGVGGDDKDSDEEAVVSEEAFGQLHHGNEMAHARASEKGCMRFICHRHVCR